jgi:hypothetical protein
MKSPGHNHLDRQRRLLPRDYAREPHRFGVDATLTFHVPPGGDVPSAQIARTQHDLVVDYRALPRRPSGAELGRRLGFSASMFSRCVTGRTWICQAVTTALLIATRHARRPDQQPLPTGRRVGRR